MELRGWGQTFPTCPPQEEGGSGDISALPRHYFALGCPLSQGTAVGSAPSPEPTHDKGQRGIEPTSLQCSPLPPHVIWLRYLGSPTGSPPRSMDLQWHHQPVAVWGGKAGGTGGTGGTTSPAAQLLQQTSPQCQNFMAGREGPRADLFV